MGTIGEKTMKKKAVRRGGYVVIGGKAYPVGTVAKKKKSEGLFGKSVIG